MQTAQDIVAYLLAANGGGAQDGENTAIRHAVIHGVREVMQSRDWLFHVRSGGFNTGIVQTVGSTTENSSRINLASVAGFVPGRIVDVAGFSEPVRITHVGPNFIHVDQVAKSTVYGLLVRPQQYYDLPPDLKDIDALATRTVGTLHTRISPTEWQRLEVNHRGSGEPYYYTVMRSDVNPDRYQIRFVGTPTNNTRVSYTYRITPRPIKYLGYERICRQGTVQMSNIDNAMTVTGTGTAFPQDCVGCYIRFGSLGMEADAAGSTNPFVMERRIERWLSSAGLVVSNTSVYSRPDPEGVATQPTNFDAGELDLSHPPQVGVEPNPFDANDAARDNTGVPVLDASSDSPYVTTDYDSLDTPIPAKTKYAITDVIDASPHMYTAILSACELWHARLAGRDYATAIQVYNRDLRIAMENDTVTPKSGEAPLGATYPSPRTMGWHSDLEQDVG